MVTHINPTSDEGRVPTPAELIIVDLMSAVLSNVDVRLVVCDPGDPDSHNTVVPVPLMSYLHSSVAKYGFSDDGLLALLREKGYHVESTNTSLTISIPQ